MQWTELLVNLLTSGGVIAGATYLGTKIVDLSFDKRLADFEHKLQRESAKFQHSLEQSAMINRVRFEALHTRRAQLIVELHEDILQAVSKLNAFVHPVQYTDAEGQKQLGKEAIDLAFTLDTKVIRNGLFFDERFATQLREFARNLLRFAQRCEFEFNEAKKTGENPYFGGDDNSFKTAFEKIHREHIPVLSELERQFRSLLGVESTEPTK